MGNEDAEGSLPSKMSHSQAQFPDMKQICDWNPLTKGDAPSPCKEGLYSTTVSANSSDTSSASLRKPITIFLTTVYWERGKGNLDLGHGV